MVNTTIGGRDLFALEGVLWYGFIAVGQGDSRNHVGYGKRKITAWTPVFLSQSLCSRHLDWQTNSHGVLFGTGL